MKVLVQYDYPPAPGGLATQGDLLYRGLKELGVETFPAPIDSPLEKEWYYNWFKPDVVVGVGFWGHAPQLILHPQQYGITPVPWLVADGYVANYQEAIGNLPLVLTTSNWVTQVYKRDGINTKNFRTLPVGCDTDAFRPIERNHPNVQAIRNYFGVKDDEIMILTVGGDAASKGAQEVMQALAMVKSQLPPWKYICKVWPQPRTEQQNAHDLKLAADLGIEKNVIYSCCKISRNFMPYLIAACDIYAAPSRLEGFGMVQVEANACGKPVIGIKAMGLLDTMIHKKTALLANVAMEVKLRETVNVYEVNGRQERQCIVFKNPRTVDFRASVNDIAEFLVLLMNDREYREKMGEAGRKNVVEKFDYRVVAKQFITYCEEILHIR